MKWILLTGYENKWEINNLKEKFSPGIGFKPGSLEDPGSNPGPGENFSLKLLIYDLSDGYSES